MLTHIHPKLPMRDKVLTRDFYVNSLDFTEISDYGDYLIVAKDQIEIHFFKFEDLNPKENYGQVYIRTNDIDILHQSLIANGTAIHPNGAIGSRPWGQREFSLLDPDHNLLTFGQDI
ncbi:MAG: bleomycin resistance protein [Bacteroidia bacterium]